MKKLHLISGLPRSGSTLLCQMLNMNPEFHATATSPMAEMLASQQSVFSHSGAFKAVDRIAYYNSFAEAQKAFLFSFYKSHKNIVFDKNRGWPSQLLKLDEILDNSDSKILWTYRDPKEVIVSLEMQHRIYPLLQYSDEVQNPGSLGTLDSRVKYWLADNSLVTAPAFILQEAINNGYGDRIKIVNYTSIVNAPEATMNSIHEFLGEETFDYAKHKFKDLKQSTTEFDSVYNYKFSHKINESVLEQNKHYLPALDIYNESINKRFEWIISHCSGKAEISPAKHISREERLGKK